MKKTKNFGLLFFILLINFGLFAQDNLISETKDYIIQNYKNWGLEKEDVNDLQLTYSYTDPVTGIFHSYYNQNFNSTPVENAIISVHIGKDGIAKSLNGRFVKNLASKINSASSSPTISIDYALKTVLNKYEVKQIARFANKVEISKNKFKFLKNEHLNSDINGQLIYTFNKDRSQLILAWNFEIDLKGEDIYSINIDAKSGKFINENSLTIHCSFPGHNHFNKHENCTDKPRSFTSTKAKNTFNAQGTGSYKVFGFPTESYTYAERTLKVDPADIDASPFGWHDTDGIDGPESTLTKGNNVSAYLDLDDTDQVGYQPDGGDSLLFDFPYDYNSEPHEMEDAAVTNLFYSNNAVHDFAYEYGFTEEAGNFQQNNYGKGGQQNDPVQAQGQDGYNLNDGDHVNNANFGTPSDGNSGRMQMYKWQQTSGLLKINSPSSIQGFYDTGTAAFGPDIVEDNVSITGSIVRGFDDSSSSAQGCETLNNPEEISGNVAMIDRGICFFQEKALIAEEAGAIALIICNFEPSTIGMAAVNGLDAPSIPTLSLGKPDCDRIKLAMDAGDVSVTFEKPSTGNGPDYFDACFDNGVIAHEYAHGISNRLTGGPIAAGCLGNPEQMGEGWSDFFALIMTVEDGDTGANPRGVGNYLVGQDEGGLGIRHYPYSTDMEVNPLTYGSVFANTEIHALGEVWTAMIWDLYWAFVDKYGFDNNMKNDTSGNSLAIQLVMTGMKMQTCSPGFVDGRDAILMADNVLNQGANECLIWEVFARRGLGFSASQGSNQIAADGKEAFDTKPSCSNAFTIKKSADLSVDSGQAYSIDLIVSNYANHTVSNVLVTDEIPDGCMPVSGSSDLDFTINGNLVIWEIDSLTNGEVLNISYEMQSGNKTSKSLYFENFEGEVNDFITIDIENENDPVNWALLDLFDAHSGDISYSYTPSSGKQDEALVLFEKVEITGDFPILRFFHNYDTEHAEDGGILEYSTDFETWIDFEDKIIVNPYDKQISYQTFVIPNKRAFTGVSGGFIPVYVDLTDFIGESIYVRWRFGAGDTGLSDFWLIDDVEFLEASNYWGEACVSSDGQEVSCDSGTSYGTFVEPSVFVSVNPDLSNKIQFDIYPNPTNKMFRLVLNESKAHISIFTIDGKLKHKQFVNKKKENIDVSNLEKGIYFLKIKTSLGTATKKLIIE